VETVRRAADTLCKTTHLTEFALVEDESHGKDEADAAKGSSMGASYASHTGMIHGSSTGQAASSYSPSYSPPTNGATHGIPAFDPSHPSYNMVMAYCSYNNLAQQKASASCAAACQPAKDCASGNPSINCEAWKPWCMGAFVDNSSMDQHGNSGGSYGSSGGSYGSSGSNGHANPAAKCQKCHTADKPMGVNCFTSLADLMNGGQPIEGKGGLLLGTVCAGTEYTQTYMCTQAYDYNFKNRAAADGACAHYKNLCCTAPTPAPTPSDHELARTLKMSGTCAVPIVSVAGCESAARAIGFSATKAELIATPFGPPGCWMAGSQLYFNTETDSSKAAPDGNIPNPGSCSHHYQCICGADANMGSSNHGGGGSYGNGSGGSFGSGGNHHA
jgi:uncharacterized membrane protein YgcG